jgi:hypothetical protein
MPRRLPMLGVMVVLMVLALLAGFVATNGGPAGLAVGLLLAMLVFICFAAGQLFSNSRSHSPN